MNKIIAVGAQAREEMARGADFLADIVSSTLGPFGLNVFLDKKNSITNDGVSVAREVHISHETLLPDGKGGYLYGNEMNNRGAVALREAATKTNDIAGDGTTTATVLAQEIYHALSRLLGSANVLGSRKPSDLIAQVEHERELVTQALVGMATPITTEVELVASAVVAVEDAVMGELIGRAQWKLGQHGFLLVEETAERTSSVEYVKGVRIDNGFGTSQIINNPERQTLEVADAGILLTSYTIKTLGDWNSLMKLFEPAWKSGIRELVVVARAWTDETINYCLQNINKGSLKIYPLSAPYTDMTERMKDLAAITGATFYDSENCTLEDMMTSGIGRVKKVVAQRMEAIIAGVEGDYTDKGTQKRVSALQKQLDGSQSEFEKKTLSERLAQLQGGFAIVHVGSPSDMERHRLRDKCEDAVNAVRAALQEGTVPGAGAAYVEASKVLPDDALLKKPLLAIHERIMASAPQDFSIELWVRDPLLVVRVALQQACVAASSFATAGGVITVAAPKPLDELLRRQAPPQT